MIHNRSRTTMLAGWLFADLFLVILLVGLASLPSRPSPKVHPTSSPTPTVSSTPTPTHTHPAGLNPHFLHFTITLSPEDFRAGEHHRLQQEVDAKLDRLDPKHVPVGFALIFASDSVNEISRGVATATSAFKFLHANAKIFAAAAGMGYWGGENGDDFQFKIFLLS